MLRFAAILLTLALLAACAAAPPPASTSANHFSAVPGANFHATSRDLSFAAPGTGFSVPPTNMGSPASIGSFSGAMPLNAAVPTSGFQPSGIPAGYRPMH